MTCRSGDALHAPWARTSVSFVASVGMRVRAHALPHSLRLLLRVHTPHCAAQRSLSAGIDVHRCARMCGKYYHLACLKTNPRTQFMRSATVAPFTASRLLECVTTGADDAVGTLDAPTALIATPEQRWPTSVEAPPDTSVHFVCPFHTCAGCLKPFDVFRPPLYFRCHSCPTAYHYPVRMPR